MSLPFSNSTPARKASNGEAWERISAQDSHPYVVCLDCGKHFDYDWSRMRVVK
jgi:hypothetical protein